MATKIRLFFSILNPIGISSICFLFSHKFVMLSEDWIFFIWFYKENYFGLARKSDKWMIVVCGCPLCVSLHGEMSLNVCIFIVLLLFGTANWNRSIIRSNCVANNRARVVRWTGDRVFDEWTFDRISGTFIDIHSFALGYTRGHTKKNSPHHNMA